MGGDRTEHASLWPIHVVTIFAAKNPGQEIRRLPLYLWQIHHVMIRIGFGQSLRYSDLLCALGVSRQCSCEASATSTDSPGPLGASLSQERRIAGFDAHVRITPQSHARRTSGAAAVRRRSLPDERPCKQAVHRMKGARSYFEQYFSLFVLPCLLNPFLYLMCMYTHIYIYIYMYR